MTFDLTTTAGVDPEISAAIAIAERLAPLADALGLGDLSIPEMQLFAMVSHHTGLDPFTRQIYAVKRKGKVVHQTGIDGYRSVAERKSGQYAGSDEPTFEDCDCGTLPTGHPKVARVVVHRLLPGGHMVDQVGVARWHELYPGAGEDGFMWRKMPFNQLAKCAEANGLRKAFPQVLGGVYIEEEMQQANTVEGSAVTLPTAAERIAARRAAAEQPVVEPAAAAEPVEPPAAAPTAEVAQVTTPTEDAPAATGLCGAESPYGDAETCGMPAGHLEAPRAIKVHRILAADGTVTASWPVAKPA